MIANFSNAARMRPAGSRVVARGPSSSSSNEEDSSSRIKKKLCTAPRARIASISVAADRVRRAHMPITASVGSAKFSAARPDLDDLIKRRFFYRQAFEIYGGVAGFYT
eukprot:scaffold1044_cov120-Isochrysis_galbana.AAC.23